MIIGESEVERLVKHRRPWINQDHAPAAVSLPVGEALVRVVLTDAVVRCGGVEVFPLRIQEDRICPRSLRTTSGFSRKACLPAPSVARCGSRRAARRSTTQSFRCPQPPVRRVTQGPYDAVEPRPVRVHFDRYQLMIARAGYAARHGCAASRMRDVTQVEPRHQRARASRRPADGPVEHQRPFPSATDPQPRTTGILLLPRTTRTPASVPVLPFCRHQ